MVEERRWRRICEVASKRTDHIVPVVEGLYDLGNIGAVMRTSEGFGVQEMHVVNTMEEKYKQSRSVSSGSEKWLDLVHWSSSVASLQHLKDRGYQTAVAHCDHPAAVGLAEVDFSVPTAIVFGNEHAGVSTEVVEAADVCFSIPVLGFVQSFNVSVAAAVTLQQAMPAVAKGSLRQLSTAHYRDRQALTAEFLARSVLRGSPAHPDDVDKALAFLTAAAGPIQT